MLLHSLKKQNKNNKTEISAIFETSSEKSKLWFSVDSKYEDWIVDDRYDAFIVALLPIAMKNRENITVRGAMSQRLYYSLSNYYIFILNNALPYLHTIKIQPDSVVTPPFNSQNNIVGASFSGGIDSFNTIISHTSKDIPLSYRITHLFFFNAGGHHGKGEQAQRLFFNRYNMLSGFPKKAGFEYVAVDSNIGDFQESKFRHIHVSSNISCALILQNAIKTYYYASGYQLNDCKFGIVDNIAYTDPYTIHHLSTETFNCVSTGYQYSRVEKTQQVSQYEPSYNYLDVCIEPPSEGGNCSVCEKCCRTLLTLEILGCIDKYKNVFNLSKYFQQRSRYINILIQCKDKSYAKEILNLAENTNFRFPFLLSQSAQLKGFFKRHFLNVFINHK